MARADLEALRTALIDTFYLTSAEIGSMRYWSEEKLLETLELFEGIAEVDADFEDKILDVGYGTDFEDEDYADLYGWEYECVIDYGENA